MLTRMKNRWTVQSVMVIGIVTLVIAMRPTPAVALDDAHYQLASERIDKAIAFLRANQNEDGSWSPQWGPAVTGLVVAGMLRHPDIDSTDPAVVKALDYIMARQDDSGRIADEILGNYNTAISLMALSQVANKNEKVTQAIQKAQQFLISKQYQIGTEDGMGGTVDENHPFYGGAGYDGGSGRPDMSNTIIMLQALFDSGVPCTDPAYQRALVFLERCQGIASNDKFADVIEQDGGFIYATSINRDHIGTPVSYASPDELEAAKQGRPVSRLRTYGSMTYAGFMSYLYAKLDRDDPRVKAAHNWIRKNWTLDRNPGMPEAIQHDGYFYYLYVFSRAMHAWGDPVITDIDGRNHNWANQIIAQLAAVQQEDGSFVNTRSERWGEKDPNLVTAYALFALQLAVGNN